MASKFVSVARMAVINSPGQQNYMGEVSRLLFASPRPRPMETFLLILFSSLVGIDAPYSCYKFLILFHLVFYHYFPHDCHSVM